MKTFSYEYDVAVIGGGPAGLAAAVTAARMGRKVALFEKNGFLGGAMAIGLSPLGFLAQDGKQCIAGFGEEFIERLKQRGDSLGHRVCPKHNSVTCINAEGVKILALEMCLEAGVDVILHCEALEVKKTGNKITNLIMYGKCNQIDVSAKIYIDCTGDGDVAYLAGCSYEMGQEGTNMLQPPTVMFTLEGVENEKLFDYVEKHPEELRYNRPGIFEDERYSPDYFREDSNHVFVGLQSTFRDLKAKGELPVDRESFIYISSTNPGEVYVNSVRILNADATDIRDLSRAEIEGTLQIPKLIKLLKERIPGFENCHLSSIAANLGVRETRRFEGISRVVAEDCAQGSVTDDTICLSGYKIDIHSGKDDGLFFKAVEKPFGIPYGALVSAEVDNLLFAGRCISCDAIALGSLRVIPTCLAMGQAAGVGAALSVEEEILPKAVQTDKIREILLTQKAILSMED
ncbi:MAG: FAD-dependent oxidoreductase [Clostridia bacterium]|nr:FAD-dependent oxidoreductase [Clostridia bacterium]